MNYIEVIRVIVSESMSVSDSDAQRLRDTNKLAAGKIRTQIQGMKQITNASDNKVHSMVI